MSKDGRVRVLHMGLDDRKGGIERFLFNMSSNIDWDRFKFDFLCYGKHPAFGKELRDMGAELVMLPSRKNLPAYINSLNGALSRGYDIFHMHKNSAMDFLPAVVAKRHPTKLVVHAHNTEANVGGKHGILVGMGRNVFRADADLRLACSPAAGEWLFGEGASFEFFPNAVKLADFAFDPAARTEIRTSLGLESGVFTVGIVGRLVKQKNYPFMLRTFSLLRQLVPDAVLLAVGEGPLMGEIENLAVEMGITDGLRLLGSCDDVSRLYSAMDCLCVPSLWEGFSYVTLEAQASGLPCLISNAIPPEARITSLVYGPLQLSEDLWAAKLAGLAASSSPRCPLTGDNLAAMCHFNVGDAAQRLMRIYEGLVGWEVVNDA
jgi:glycosyltransferase involved in cell wall biosynthesis